MKFHIAFEKIGRCVTTDQLNCSNSDIVSLCIGR